MPPDAAKLHPPGRIPEISVFLVVWTPICGVKLRKIPAGIVAVDSSALSNPIEFTEFEGRDV
jgi:hypothetical protein